MTTNSNGDNGKVWVDKFSNLVPNALITQLTISTVSVAGDGRIKFYADDGGSGNPGTLIGQTGSVSWPTNGVFTAPASIYVPSDGVVWAGFETDSPSTGINWATGLSNGLVEYVAHTYGSGPNPFGTPTAQTAGPVETLTYVVNAAVVRVKVYQDDGSGGQPSTLLGESNSVILNSTGIQSIPLISDATIPASGNVWAGFEINCSATIFLMGSGLPSGSSYSTSHTYGTGPSPFGTGTAQTTAPWGQIAYDAVTHVLLSVYQDDGTGGGPGTLLGQSGSLAVTTTGTQNFTLSPPATIPASGNVWAGFQTDASSLNLFLSTGLAAGSRDTVSQTYGTNPNPFGTITQQTTAQWEQVTVEQIPSLSFKWDGTTLSTSPTTVHTNSTGGFSGVTFTIPLNATVGTHTVNATDSNGKWVTAPFNIYLNIQVGNVTSGQFTQTYKTSGGT